jgi:plastocyanin
MRKLLSGLLIMTLALGVAACGDDDDDDAATTEDAGGEAADITISGSAFDPSTLESAAGDVSWTVSNEDGFAHTFTSDDLGFDESIDGGASATVNVALEAGTYEFHCKIHPSMTGEITVS